MLLIEGVTGNWYFAFIVLLGETMGFFEDCSFLANSGEHSSAFSVLYAGLGGITITALGKSSETLGTRGFFVFDIDSILSRIIKSIGLGD